MLGSWYSFLFFIFASFFHFCFSFLQVFEILYNFRWLSGGDLIHFEIELNFEIGCNLNCNPNRN